MANPVEHAVLSVPPVVSTGMVLLGFPVDDWMAAITIAWVLIQMVYFTWRHWSKK